jgi:PKD repeat protein
VKFDASASSEKHGKIVGYVWKFGDGKKSKGRVVKHKYAAPGRYKVRLVVVDQHGVRARASLKIRVRRAS